ncbi:hypothetical protein MHO82_12605 [Vibrio sp. Of7-15]|uniref:hypothetical protein n=1 Tax=Vibrio sp. Of7-15 TaxID=2724879 RepID=UPI001EF16DEB|nr:hypothetical protein [Vibrio sp. Of7-15]MCG7497704.1 hypothetical protein [Vibrio sp. Of7-15]
MKNIVFSTLVALSSVQHVNASQLLEYHCIIDYTQDIIVEQTNYMKYENYETGLDLNELGIRIASNLPSHPWGPDPVFILDESLIRDYKVSINGSLLTFKSNNKTLVSADLNNIDENINIATDLNSYSSSRLSLSFEFYNSNIMKEALFFSVLFSRDEKSDELTSVSRTLELTVDGHYLNCQDEVGKTTFKEYQQHWISFYEAISKKKAEYTE